MKKAVIKLQDSKYLELVEKYQNFRNNYFNAKIEEDEIQIFSDGIVETVNPKDVEILLSDCWLGDIYQKIYNLCENIEVPLEELLSAKYDANPYDVEPQLAGGSGQWVWDEEEMWSRQREKFYEKMEQDPAWFVEDLHDWIPEARREDPTPEYSRYINAIVEDYLK